MGNIGSFRKEQDNKTNRKLQDVIDFIATNYILTQNYQDMINLNNIEYCDKLIILTSDIISKNLNYLDIKFLAQRLKYGEEINEMANNSIIYMNKNNIDELDLKNKTNKRRMCIGISKFYIKIAHLFASIVTTINPTYTFKDLSGNISVTRLDERNNLQINGNISSVEISSNTLCNRRINSLLNNQNYNVSNEDEIVIKPQVCNMNSEKNKLGDESGIPELEYLYYDKYNYDKGIFGGRLYMKDNMSETMYKEYQNDLLLFYKKFTGNDNIPIIEKEIDGVIQKVPSITKFSQIPLKSYNKTTNCSDDGLFTKEVKGTLKEKLFSDYANHIKSMIERTENIHNKLLNIIDKIFVFKTENIINDDTGIENILKNKTVTINPKLTEAMLQDLINETRKIIVNLYLTCEDDFNKGLEIFEAIVENQIIITSKQQISELQKLTENAVLNIDSKTKLTDDYIINKSSEEDIKNQINDYNIQSLSVLKLNPSDIDISGQIYQEEVNNNKSDEFNKDYQFNYKDEDLYKTIEEDVGEENIGEQDVGEQDVGEEDIVDKDTDIIDEYIDEYIDEDKDVYPQDIYEYEDEDLDDEDLKYDNNYYDNEYIGENNDIQGEMIEEDKNEDYEPFQDEYEIDNIGQEYEDLEGEEEYEPFQEEYNFSEEEKYEPFQQEYNFSEEKEGEESKQTQQYEEYNREIKEPNKFNISPSYLKYKS
jgi:hypothetical protein